MNHKIEDLERATIAFVNKSIINDYNLENLQIMKNNICEALVILMHNISKIITTIDDKSTIKFIENFVRIDLQKCLEINLSFSPEDYISKKDAISFNYEVTEIIKLDKLTHFLEKMNEIYENHQRYRKPYCAELFSIIKETKNCCQKIGIHSSPSEFIYDALCRDFDSWIHQDFKIVVIDDNSLEDGIMYNTIPYYIRVPRYNIDGKNGYERITINKGLCYYNKVTFDNIYDDFYGNEYDDENLKR